MKWSVLTLVGADQQGIVAAVSNILFEAGCQLAEASMMRLGGNFAIMLRVRHGTDQDIAALLAPVTRSMNLHLHLDEDVAAAVHHIEPDVHITVYGADRAGIVAQVTGVLAEAGLNIIDLETAVGGESDRPIYIMSIEGNAKLGIDKLASALQSLGDDIEVNLTPIDTLRG
ncbi:MAG: ACT domain-containing protein [Gammaproteobacteria bacterium]|nr:ACT domain-containing protein [Gammaproteobacteria bacterium]